MHDKTSLENEQALLQLIAGGDENAFATLFHHYQQHLLRVVYQFVKSQALSEEIVQDVFLKIWTGREKLPEIQQFRSWLFILTSKTDNHNIMREHTALLPDLHITRLQRPGAVFSASRCLMVQKYG